MSSYIFDDGSISAKVLQQEVEAQVIKVKDGKLEDWLALISENGITKVYLHYCYEDYTPGLRAEINTELAKNPNLRIICQYENNPRSDIEKKTFKAIKHTEIASDSLTPKELGGHEVPSDDFVNKLIEVNKDKIKTIDYGKYTVGGNDSLRSQKVTRNESLDENDNYISRSEHQNLFTDKINEYRDKRRRKKKE